MLGISTISIAWYGIYRTWNLAKTQSEVNIKSTVISHQLQSWLNHVQSNIDSGIQLLGSGADRLLVSGQVVMEQKRQQVLKYIQQQKDELKKQAQKTVEDEAKKKIQNVFNGR